MAEDQLPPLPPRSSGSFQSAVQLNPPPPPLKKPSRLGKILVENDEKIKNLMHEDQRRRRLSVLDTSALAHYVLAFPPCRHCPKRAVIACRLHTRRRGSRGRRAAGTPEELGGRVHRG